MEDIVETFIESVSSKDEFSRAYLEKHPVEETQEGELNRLLNFFMECFNMDIGYLSDAFISINKSMMEERYYFVRTGCYRNSSFAEVNAAVYQNREYMNKHMTGLAISDYIWTNHVGVVRWFDEKLKSEATGGYLEIGPGFGQFLMRAIQSGRFTHCEAIDISRTSVEKARAFLEYQDVPENSYEIYCGDFFEYSTQNLFDFITAGEVLEHLEDPLAMLKKICSIMKPDGRAFITTVINSPAVDHIYLFRSAEEVYDMARHAGFAVEDSFCAAANGVPMEKAVRKNLDITIGMFLRRKEEDEI